jgi:hypothetical protein
MTKKASMKYADQNESHSFRPSVDADQVHPVE